MFPACTHLKSLPPAYFALVMATGIISITSHLHGYSRLSIGLLYLNVFQFLALTLMFTLRLLRHREVFLADLGDHLRGPGFFTVVAGTGVLGAQFFVVAGLEEIGSALGILTILLWLGLLYTVFALLIIKANPPTIERGINGGWLVAIVATQSVALVCFFMGARGGGGGMLLLAGFGAWCFGIMLYIWIISLIFYRYMFFAMEPGDLSPPYWINMGAVAISTLAGCNLIGASSLDPLLTEVRPFLKGTTFLLWSTATWWIPMLIILGFWRHVVRRFPVQYDPLYWGMVFPLGMYSACTFRLAQELGLPAVLPLAKAFLLIGVIVWCVVFAGLLKRVARNVAELASQRAAVAEEGR